MSIQIRHLRLVGAVHDYDVSFVHDGAARSLATIAGEISTGKSSVLEFVNYCLGASSHPKHQEIQRKVHAALLEVELSGEVQVIERRVFSEDESIYVHQCTLESMAGPHTKVKRNAVAGSPTSLSVLLLSHCGLAGILLKEAPNQAGSGTDPLSFRDLMWLCFMPNARLDGKHLLNEGHHMRQLKLRQVVEVVFNVHNDQLAHLSGALDEARKERTALLAEVHSLQDFLIEQEIPERLEVELQLQTARTSREDAAAALDAVRQQMIAATSYATQLRSRFRTAQQRTRRVAVQIRDRETLLIRLEPLQGQYAEDESKLIFFAEARQLFDPLNLTMCPACLQVLQKAPTLDDGACSLCGQRVEAAEDPIDLKRELAGIRQRRREVDRYFLGVQDQLTALRREQAAAADAESAAQAALDNRVATDVAPYVSQRDEVVRDFERADLRVKELERLIGYHLGLDRRRGDMNVLDARIAQLGETISGLQKTRPSKDALVSLLSARFETILRAFGFPKLADPEPPSINADFVPYVRGNPYRDIGSTGALTLISLAWILTMFEVAVEGGYAHPGFLMIDSPQKNLTPREGGRDEFASPEIVSRVWRHMLGWSTAHHGKAQILVVDNAPPAEASDTVVVRYSGSADRPPYGLIDDEVSGPAEASAPGR